MRVIQILAVSVLAVACARDAPMAPGRPTDPATEQLAALAAAITDAQEWLLPSLGDRDIATDAVAGRFADLASSFGPASSRLTMRSRWSSGPERNVSGWLRKLRPPAS